MTLQHTGRKTKNGRDGRMAMDNVDIDLEVALFEGIDDGRLARFDAKQRQRVIDYRTDKIAKMLAMYPTTDTRKLAKMFNVTYNTLVRIAKDANIKKVESRGGHNRRNVEVVNLDGYVVNAYESIHQAAVKTGVDEKRLQYRVKHGGGIFKPGMFIRYKIVDVAVVQQQTEQ